MTTASPGARLSGLPMDQWGDEVRRHLLFAVEQVEAMTDATGPETDRSAANPLPTLGLIAHQAKLLGPFLGWASALALDGVLDHRLAEVVALRAAYRCRSAFEWREHRIHGLAAGLSEEEIDRIAAGAGADGWTALERALISATDQMHDVATIDGETFGALADELSPAELVEIVLLSGQYRMLSVLANAAGVDAELGDGPTPWDGEPGGEGAPSVRGHGRSHLDPALLDLDGSVALVVGGSQSIGRGCAVQLARAGCRVVVADIADGGEAVEEMRALGAEAVFMPVNARSRSEVRGLVEQVVDQFGRLDVAVNTVGSTKGPKPFLDIEDDEWDEVVAKNLSTAMLGTQLEALAMIGCGVEGRIINVSSLSGIAGAPNAAGYGAANAGVLHFTASAALELARYGIRVNCIVPGTHLTETTRAALAGDDPDLAEWVRLTGESVPLGRLGEPWETGGVAVFLASKLSAYVTGQGILSDGGLIHTTARPPIGMAMQPVALRHLGGGRLVQ